MKKAYVNGELIAPEAVQFELDRLVKFYASHGMKPDEVRANLDKLIERAQEQAIGAKLLLKRASELDLPVTAAAVDAQVEQVKEQVGGEANFKEALKAQGITEEKFRKELEKGCRVDALVNQACSGVPEPTQEDVAAYYQAHQAEFVGEDQVLCYHILVKTEGADADDKARALDKINAIRARVVGEINVEDAFKRAARENSDCPSGAEGGSLGWFGPGMMVPEFDKAAFSMKKGEISGVVETQFGYHIILKADEKAGGPLSLVDVADSVRDLLRHEARGRAMDAFVAELREKATIEYK